MALHLNLRQLVHPTDVQHPLWHKRPDWFLALNAPRLYDGQDLRRSYVVWQEGSWLRWCDQLGNWFLTDAEAAHLAQEQAQQQAKAANQRTERLAARLRELDINPDEL